MNVEKIANTVAGAFIVLCALAGFLLLCTLLGWGIVSLFHLAEC